MPEEIVLQTSDENNPLDSSSEGEESDVAGDDSSSPKETPFHEHPRFKELISEKNELKETNAKLQNQLLELVKTPQTVQAKVEEKIYTANTLEEKEFWQTQEKLIESKIAKAREEERSRYESEIKGLHQAVGRTVAQDFLKNHTDVEKGSPEMERIVTKAYKMASTGAFELQDALEDSYRSVMFEKIGEKAVKVHQEKTKEKTREKVKANVEQTTLSPNSPVIKKYQDFDAAFDKTAKDLGIDLH